MGRYWFQGVLLLSLKLKSVDGHGMAGEHLVHALHSGKSFVCLMVYMRRSKRFEMRK